MNSIVSIIMKIYIENTFHEKHKELLNTPKAAVYSESRLRSSKSCKMSIRIPTVESDKKEKKIVQNQNFPLRAKSASRVVGRKPLSVTPNLIQIQVNEKGCENRSASRKTGFRSVKCGYDKYFNEPIENILSTQLSNFPLLPNPNILEHKRAVLRLRKLKLIPVKHGKENCSLG
jgi:hypothetical protein